MIRSPALRAARSAMVAVGSMPYLELVWRRMITGGEGRGYASAKLCANIDS
jgi:hypothetical protein